MEGGGKCVNTAKYVSEQIEILKGQNIPLSEKCWQIALLCVGWAYVFGAWGAECTVGERKQRYKYNAIANILESCQRLRTKEPKSSCSGCKWYPGGERTRCFDCRGFTDWILKQFGFDLIGEGATSQWNTKSNWCIWGTVADGVPDNVLVNLFIWNGSTMKHTGFYYNGATCECSSGVQHFEKMKKNRWTHWAVAKCFESECIYDPSENGENAPNQPSDPADDEIPTDDLPTVRRGDKGNAVRSMQNLLLDRGYDLGKWGADGDFGAQTEKAVKQFQRDWGLKVDGVCGEQTWKMLMSTPEKPKQYTVTIPHLSSSVADEIVNKYGGEKKLEG